MEKQKTPLSTPTNKQKKIEDLKKIKKTSEGIFKKLKNNINLRKIRNSFDYKEKYKSILDEVLDEEGGDIEKKLKQLLEELEKETQENGDSENELIKLKNELKMHNKGLFSCATTINQRDDENDISVQSAIKAVDEYEEKIITNIEKQEKNLLSQTEEKRKTEDQIRRETDIVDGIRDLMNEQKNNQHGKTEDQIRRETDIVDGIRDLMNEQKNNQLGNRAKEILSIYNQIREEQNDNQPGKTEKKDNIKIKENLKIEDLKIGDDFIFIDRNGTENKAKITNIDGKYIEFDEFVGDKTVRNRLDFDTLEKMSIFEKKENETPGTIPEMYQEPIPGTNPNPNPGTIPEIGQEPIPGTNQDPITETTDDTIDDTTDDITNPNPENQTLSLESNISSVSDIHLEQAKEHAEERLRAEYARMHPLSLNKLRFFLNRNNLRQRYIQEHLETTKGLFEGSDSLVDKTTDASTRIGIEKNVFEKDSINIENIIENNAAINEICSQFLNNQLNEEGFKIAFRHIIERLSENNENIRTALDKMDYLGTNILDVLKKQKNYECLINNINGIIQDTSIDNDEKNNQIRELINEYVRENKEDLTCLKEIPIENLERGIRGQIANINAQRNNLNMRIQLLSGGKGAYKIDNEDQKEGRLQKISEFIDRHPWLSGIGTTGLVIGGTVGLAAAIPTGIGIAAGMGLGALTLGSVQFLKKRGHFTAEHEGYEKRLVRNENEYEGRINELNNQISSSGVIRRFILNRRLNRIRRDYEIYRQSTQREDILQPSQSLSNQIIERTLNNTLTSEDIIAGLVRLDSYDELGHNFLTSSSRNCLEKEYKNLHESLVLGMNKLGLLNLNQIRSCPEYATLREELRSGYNTALENFKTERRKLSLRSGAQTAAVYLGTSVALQYFFSTGLFTKDTITSVQGPSTTVSKDIVDPNLNQALLGNESQKILDSITQKTTPETFWETLTQQYGVAKGNIIKNNILEHLWSLKEGGAYELVNIAKNGGGIDVSSSAFHDTFNKLQSWGYNVNETWLKEATSNLLNGGDIAQYDPTQKAILSETFFDYIHRNGLAKGSNVYQVFFDTVNETIPGASQEVITKGIPNIWSGLGVPIFGNTFLAKSGQENNG